MSAVNGYIGRSPADSSVIIARQIFTPTSPTTTFTFSAGYQVGYIEAYVNGLKLVEATEYQATDTTTVTLTTSITSGDTLELVASKAFNLGIPIDSVPGDFNVGGDLSVNGSVNFDNGFTDITAGIITATNRFEAGPLGGIGVTILANGTITTINTITGSQLIDNSNPVLRGQDSNGTRFNISGAGEIELYDPSLQETVNIRSFDGRIRTQGEIQVGPTTGIGITLFPQGSAVLTGVVTANNFHADNNAETSYFLGDVGVGTPITGSADLAVVGSPVASFSIGQNVDGTGQNHLGIYYGNLGAGNTAANIFTSNGDLNFMTDGAAPPTSKINFQGGQNTWMTIANNGSVGIGTTLPSEHLHVHTQTSGASYIHLTNNTTGGGSGDGVILGLDSSEQYFIWSYENNNLIFGNNNTERLRITSNGNVGIRTTIATTELDVNGTITTTNINTTSLNGGPLAGFRNKIINGSMQFWQRGFPGNSNSGYQADRMFATTDQEHTRVDGFGEFPYALTATGADRFQMRTNVELPRQGYAGEFQPGTTWTFSWWQNGPAMTNTQVYFDDSMNSNSSNRVTISASGGQTIVETQGSWNRYAKTFTIAGGVVPNAANNIVGMYLYSTGNDVSVTGIQLELGSAATPFEHRPLATELALCQRYYVQGGQGMMVIPSTATAADGFWQAPVPMRTTTPTITHLNNYPLLPPAGGNDRTGSNTTFNSMSPNGALRVNVTSALLDTSAGIYINRNDTDQSFSVDAEL